MGAVCRAMKNMGLSHLRLVAPGVLDIDKLLARAIHAEDVWHRACFFDTLPEAVADCSVVVGTTARRGKKRKTSMRPRELASWLAQRPGSAALVFGNERTGLDQEEIACCNVASHIPACGEFPSLNLSHAVQIYAYELNIALGGNARDGVKGEWTPIGSAAADTLATEMADVLAGVGFYKLPGRKEQERFLRDVVCRAGLCEREGRYLKGIFDKAARLGRVLAGKGEG